MTVTLPLPLAVTAEATDTRCFGESTGSIKLDITGGMPPYHVVFTGEEVMRSTSTIDAATFDDLAAGQYNVAITDHAGCIWQQGITVLESQNQPLSARSTARPVVCSGTPTGSIALSVSGGNTPYSVALSQEDQVYTATTTDAATFDRLPVGPYTATVTDNTGCTWQQQIDISETLSAPLTCTFTLNQESRGTISVNCSGGTLPYTYHWDANIATGPVTAPLEPGSYAVTIKDNMGCVARLDGIRVTGENVVTALPGSLNRPAYRLYPNPGTGKAWLIADQSKKVSVSISNTSGRELTVFSLQLLADKPVKLNLPGNNPGVLLITLTDDFTTEVIRYVKK